MSSYIFYGFPFKPNKELTSQLKSTDHWEEVFAINAGEVNPLKDRRHDHWEKVFAVARAAPCTIGTYDYDEEDSLYVRLNGHIYSVDHTDTPIRKLPELVVPSGAEEDLRAFCETMGIEHQQPGWYLAYAP